MTTMTGLGATMIAQGPAGERAIAAENFMLGAFTNALTEGFNSKIQAIKADARGFRSFPNYRIRILFHCGKLDLQPLNALQS